MRYLQGDGPRQSSQWVRQALTSARANWLQKAFVDEVYGLGGRCHSFREWSPCPTAQLTSGQRIQVEFSNGWFTGTVQHYDHHAAASIVKFDIDHTLFSVKDKIHNFVEHTPRGGGTRGPPFELAPPPGPPAPDPTPPSFTLPLPPLLSVHRCSPPRTRLSLSTPSGCCAGLARFGLYQCCHRSLTSGDSLLGVGLPRCFMGQPLVGVCGHNCVARQHHPGTSHTLPLPPQ